MIKPNEYDNTQAGGAYEVPEVGGHHMIIKQVSETKNKNGGDMIVVLFDFAPNDVQPEFFMNQFKADVRPDKKYPHKGTSYINVLGQDGKTTRSYKTFCTCFENSNGVKINWTENSAEWCAQFKNKRIGGCFGVVHSVYNGKEYASPELRWFLSDDKVDGCTIPKEREPSAEEAKQLTSPTGNSMPTSPDGFMSIAEGVGEELPFN